jgi:hypothetical protein
VTRPPASATGDLMVSQAVDRLASQAVDRLANQR